ncbi:hypothetical protein CPB84DRAFT_1770888 [Gymnopilus junonius]|uniref:Uncharacterized protein n=1 Tax=Gymnopilus junonius TaxID=109634 RepID=A0A9P5NR35_GYMJU|nr:hypothetical protein CPB84DRAFT_1770888 [Gymnopilus junonius]
MEHGTRSFEGYHPSKTTPSGRTPLQLAVESGAPLVVKLLVKHVTTHDVEKCWRQDNISAEIKFYRQRKDLCCQKQLPRVFLFLLQEEKLNDNRSSLKKKSLG